MNSLPRLSPLDIVELDELDGRESAADITGSNAGDDVVVEPEFDDMSLDDAEPAVEDIVLDESADEVDQPAFESDVAATMASATVADAQDDADIETAVDEVFESDEDAAIAAEVPADLDEQDIELDVAADEGAVEQEDVVVAEGEPAEEIVDDVVVDDTTSDSALDDVLAGMDDESTSVPEWLAEPDVELQIESPDQHKDQSPVTASTTTSPRNWLAPPINEWTGTADDRHPWIRQS